MVCGNYNDWFISHLSLKRINGYKKHNLRYTTLTYGIDLHIIPLDVVTRRDFYYI